MLLSLLTVNSISAVKPWLLFIRVGETKTFFSNSTVVPLALTIVPYDSVGFSNSLASCEQISILFWASGK